jgi:phosphatidylglycerophosphate synthase
VSSSGSNIGRRLRQGSSATASFPPLREYALCATGGLVLLAALGPLILPQLPVSAWALSALVYAGSAAVVGDFLRRTYPHARLGLCNVVTLARLVIVTALAAALFAGGAGAWTFVALAGVALALDGVDGWLARRHGLVSSFGARFDMETDAALALVLALHALAVGAAGPVVLVLGVMRYAFVAAAAVLPWLNAPLPERFSRKAVCVVQIAALIVIQVPGMPAAFTSGLVAVAAAALVWSFAVDIVHLWRGRTG